MKIPASFMILLTKKRKPVVITKASQKYRTKRKQDTPVNLIDLQEEWNLQEKEPVSKASSWVFLTCGAHIKNHPDVLTYSVSKEKCMYFRYELEALKVNPSSLGNKLVLVLEVRAFQRFYSF